MSPSKRLGSGIAGASILVFSVLVTLNAQETRNPNRLTTEHYLELQRVNDAQISPDGKRIIYTRQVVNQIDDKLDSSLWIMNADGSEDRFLTKGSGPRWSPDGKRVLFLNDGEPKATQIFVKWIDVEGAPSQITHVLEHIDGPRWSPDGKSIAFSMFVPEKNPWSISMPEAPKDSKWTPAPRIVETLHYRQDRVGFLQDGFTHLFVVPADGGTAKQLTSGKWSVGAGELRGTAAIDWTPDGKSIVFDSDPSPDADTNYEISKLRVVDAATGAIRDLVTTPGAWADPLVSPDGRTVAFSGHPASKRSYTVSDIYVVPTAGGEMRKISGIFDRESSSMHWAPDGSGLYFEAQDHGTSNVHFASVTGGVRDVTTGAHMLGFDSMSHDLIAAGTSSDFEHPAEVVRYNLRSPQQIAKLTDVNGSLMAGMKLAKSEEINYTSSGNAKIQAWIVKPPDFDSAKKYPMILEIHGGPFGNYNVGFNYMFQNFAANGFVVLYVNPRGSTGYGGEFSGGIDHNYPGPDYDDLMAGVDATIAKGYVDTSRMYVSGCSGGGVLSSWVIGHTDRFAAAAVRCPVIDWISMTGHTDIPLFTYSFFDKPFWEDPKEWLSHSSLMYAGKVTTPTLLMTGVLDRRTPMPQTEEYYAALKKRGVPTTLLQFEGEYHGTGGKPSNYIRTQLYMMSWFNRWTRTPAGKAEKRMEAPASKAVSLE